MSRILARLAVIRRSLRRWWLALGLLPLPALAADHCVILQYHHVSAETPAVTSVTPAQFQAHLDYLAEGGFEVLPLARVVEALTEGRALPRRCVAITFDDAYVSVATEALPRLRERGWPATVFVTTEGVDQGLDAYLGWDQMRRLAGRGVVFANHSASHDHLIRHHRGEDDAAWAARVGADIERAQRRLRQELGRAPRLFVYPYGEYDLALRSLVGELAYVGLGQQSGAAGPWSDPRALPRFPVSGRYAGPEAFAVRVNSRPLPVRGQAPEEPLLPLGVSRPRLRLELVPGDYSRQALACYAGGERMAIEWEGPGRLSVRAAEALPVGRSRYNCTAPARDGSGYYWFSQPWIRRFADGGWYRE